MAKFDIVMPKLGESIIEATIVRWLKKEGDMINMDDPLCEIATDKVDSEIPSPVEGKLMKIFYQEGEVVAVGSTIASIALDDAEATVHDTTESLPQPLVETTEKISAPAENVIEKQTSARFYSPLVKSIARQENIPYSELDTIEGTGSNGRLTKSDLMDYVGQKKSGKIQDKKLAGTAKPEVKSMEKPVVTTEAGDEVVEMDRMRRLIADHMVMSKHVSAHVTSFIDVDVTKIVNWRNRVKDDFLKREKEKITFTPVFIEAAAMALRDFPGVNASVDGYNIILRKKINIGMATALPNGNLIVPVIKNTDQKNLLGLVKDVNSLANKARNNKLDPDDIQGGTFTVTNFGTFDSLTGTPVINQPQVAILGIGAIRKKPVVIETADGDVIGIRSICILSLSYDHRVVDGALGGMYLKRLAEYLEAFDPDRTI